MFGANEIVGRKYFADAGDRLFVTSMFMTLQGEGPLRGEPAFFVRLAKCNLACSFCDTYFDDGTWYSLDHLEHEIDYRIGKYFDFNIPKWARKPFRLMALVITGGEPMLQNNLGPFISRMRAQFAKIQIETNGTQYQELPASTILVCSPKCSEKNSKPDRYLKPHPLVLEDADCLKFVMSAHIAGEVESPYNSIPHWAHEWRQEKGRPIFVSPMNIYARAPVKSGGSVDQRSTVDEVISFWEPGLLDMKANQANHEYAARYCVQHGFTFNVQIHLLASVA